MPALYLYDDAKARRFEPFALTRPAGSLTVGMSPVWLRWQIVLQCATREFIGARHLDGFDEDYTRGCGTTPGMAREPLPAGSIIANARFAPAAKGPDRGREDASPDDLRGRSVESITGVWRSGGRVAAVRLARELPIEALRDGACDLETLAGEGAAEAELRGWWIDEVWDIVRLLPIVLAEDLLAFLDGPSGGGVPRFGEPPSHATVFGEHPVRVGAVAEYAGGWTGPPAAVIEPHVVLDATGGPIVIDHGAHVHAFSRLTGPCYIGGDSTVLGGDLSTCSIGPVCKVRGEMSNTIMLGYANKGHDGFVGHSILGRWSNLGAGTITSNLKNTYGTVSLWTPEGIRDTGMQFLGTLLGDHARTGIGTRLTTGTVLGAGANVYGSAMPPKVVPPFAWGERPPYAEYRCDKFLEVAERVMSRRKVALSDGARRQLAAAHAARWTGEAEP